MPVVLAILAAASGTAVNPLGPLGAAIVAGSLVMLVAYGIGANERRHWGGRPPTAQEYLNSKRKVGRVQYSTAQWSQRVLIGVSVFLALGIAVLAYGLLAT
jgi:hypothetical protein